MFKGKPGEPASHFCAALLAKPQLSGFRVVISQTLQVIVKACLLPEPHSGLAHGLGRSLDGGKSWKHPVPAYACGRRLVVRQSYGVTCSPLQSQSEYALPRCGCHDAGTACTRPCLAFPAVHAMCVGSLVSRSAGHREVVNTLAKKNALAPYVFAARFRLHACVHLGRRCPTGFGSERS